jgi:hypothetical protein
MEEAIVHRITVIPAKLTGENESTQGKPLPLLLCLIHIPSGLTWEITQVSAMTERKPKAGKHLCIVVRDVTAVTACSKDLVKK